MILLRISVKNNKQKQNTHTHTHTHTPTLHTHNHPHTPSHPPHTPVNYKYFRGLVCHQIYSSTWSPLKSSEHWPPLKIVKHDIFGVFSQCFPRTRVWVLGRFRVLGVSVGCYMKVLGKDRNANTHTPSHTPPHTHPTTRNLSQVLVSKEANIGHRQLQQTKVVNSKFRSLGWLFFNQSIKLHSEKTGSCNFNNVECTRTTVLLIPYALHRGLFWEHRQTWDLTQMAPLEGHVYYEWQKVLFINVNYVIMYSGCAK